MVVPPWPQGFFTHRRRKTGNLGMDSQNVAIHFLTENTVPKVRKPAWFYSCITNCTNCLAYLHIISIAKASYYSLQIDLCEFPCFSFSTTICINSVRDAIS